MKNFFLFALIVLALSSSAQTGDLIIKNSDKGLYLEHKVTAKENFYSIARLYNAHPKEIAALNGLDMEKGLSLGQTIRIPLTTDNFSQTVNAGIPVYYRVGEKEGLMKVSNANNKVSLENLRHWNKLQADNVSPGSKLIVGFIVAGQSPAIAKQEPEKINPQKETVVVNKEPKLKETKDTVQEKKLAVETQEKENKLASPKTEVSTVVMDNPTNKETAEQQGYFRTSFDQQVKTIPLTKNETVTSGIFKTASGWKDYKYYLLKDGIQPGTIIKIINPANNKAVYAKVLGEMSGIRLNAGFDIRISNAAAAALDIEDMDKFVVKVNY